MNRFIIFLIANFFFFSCNELKEIEKELLIKDFEEFEIKSSIRALQVVNDTTVWFAGSNGLFGYTENSGKSWKIDSLKNKKNAIHFRSIAVTKKATFILSIGTPALLYKTTDKGQNWKLVYTENHEKIFYDAMAFWNENEGIAMGDATDSCLSVILTKNGGNSWKKIDCNFLPKIEKGEAAFAASNSNIALYKNNVWIVSGGKKARVFHSPDKGKTWSVYNTPIVQGETMTGIFSVDFFDEKNGVIFGGNWEKQEQNENNKAVTSDGGKTWQLIANGKMPGYRSCVKYIPGTNGNELIAVGSKGVSYSKNKGKTWKILSKDSFYAISFGSSVKNTWLAGDKKIAKIIWE